MTRRSGRPGLTAAALAAMAAFAACQSGPGNMATSGESPALAMMQHISSAAQTCWFRSGANEFQFYRLADELNSYSGRPRILLVPAKDPEARPLLVVQAEGNPAKVQVFGPLMDQPVGNRIAAEVKHWADGGTSCSASA
jgi:hypothetical protein